MNKNNFYKERDKLFAQINTKYGARAVETLPGNPFAAFSHSKIKDSPFKNYEREMSALKATIEKYFPGFLPKKILETNSILQKLNSEPDAQMHPDGGYADEWEPTIGKDYSKDPSYQKWYARLVERETINRTETQNEESRPSTGFPQRTATVIDPETKSGTSALGLDANIILIPGGPRLPIWAWLLIGALILYAVTRKKSNG